jgi:hypothetical protein
MLSALRFPKPSANPRLPDGVRIYAISDIHGCAHLLERMLAVIDADVAHSISRDRGFPWRLYRPRTGLTIDSRPSDQARPRRTRCFGNHEAFRRGLIRHAIGFGWVHGHTPVRSAEILANRANIDTGACATGNLTLLSIEGNRLLAI